MFQKASCNNIQFYIFSEENNSETVKESKSLEVEGVKLAEAGNLEEALKSFTQAIQITPSMASGYNNRAQTLRLMGKIEGNKEKKLTNFVILKGVSIVRCPSGPQYSY